MKILLFCLILNVHYAYAVDYEKICEGSSGSYEEGKTCFCKSMLQQIPIVGSGGDPFNPWYQKCDSYLGIVEKIMSDRHEFLSSEIGKCKLPEERKKSSCPPTSTSMTTLDWTFWKKVITLADHYKEKGIPYTVFYMGSCKANKQDAMAYKAAAGGDGLVVDIDHNCQDWKYEPCAKMPDGRRAIFYQSPNCTKSTKSIGTPGTHPPHVPYSN